MPNRLNAVQPNDDIIQKYSTAYNSTSSPFNNIQNNNFNGKLGSADKLLLRLTRILFGGVIGRRVVFGYILFIHLTLFIIINWAGYSQINNFLLIFYYKKNN